MNTVLSNFFRSTTAETYKLKRTPVIWMALLSGMFGAAIVFLFYLVLIDEFVSLEIANPWLKYYKLSYQVSSLFFLVPFVVLIISTIVNTEHNSNAWKYLYSLPLRRGTIYLSKLAIILALLALTHVMVYLFTIIGGFALSKLVPVYEFQNHASSLLLWGNVVFHSFISMLGVVAVQYWLSVRWKNYIMAVGVGILGFVVSILISGRDDYDLALPHSYCMGLNKKMSETCVFAEDFVYGGLLHVEWLSIAFFIVFVFIGYYEQKISNVK